MPESPTPSDDLPPATGRVEKAESSSVSAKTTALVSAAIMVSRVLGLIRDQIFAALFSPFLRDCFTVAFRTPNMLRDLFAEGALSTAFVTVFSQKIEKEGDQSAWDLARKVLSLAVVFMSGISLAGVLLAPIIVRLLTPKWPEEKLLYTIQLAQILYPFILLVSLAALVMGILNAKKVFGVPAMASSYFNIVSVAGGWVLGRIFDPSWGATAMVCFCIGTLLGGLAQFGCQLPALFRLGFRFKFDRDWKDAGVRRVLQLMWPAVIAGSAVQVNVFLNTIFASYLPEKDGPVSWLGYAFRLMQLPLGVFGVAVATVTLPAISRVAAEGITPKFREVLGSGNRLVTFLTLPCAIVLLMLAEPLISLLYERGRFTPEETLATAAALRWYAVGLVFYAGIKVVQPAFTAIGKRFVPMFVSLGSILINAGLNSYFVFVLRPEHHGHMYLSLSTAVVAFTNCCILYFILQRTAGGLESKKLLSLILRLLPAAVGLSLVCWICGNSLLRPDRWQSYGFLLRAGTLGTGLAAAGATYLFLANLWKIQEAQQVVGIARRRLKR
jgi:putative peptidoglycan lipid II flippase